MVLKPNPKYLYADVKHLWLKRRGMLLDMKKKNGYSEKKKINLTIGASLRDFRLKNNWTQHDIAYRLGISVSVVSKLESGTTDVNLPRLEQFANIFGIDISEFFNKKEKETCSQEPVESANFKLAKSVEENKLLREKIIKLYEEIYR